MAEEIKEVKTTEEKEDCCTKPKCKCKCMHKILGLKGLALIYKIISVLAVLYIVFAVGQIWYIALTQGVAKMDAAILSVYAIITYGFFALIMITISRILKTLKKIKHAVEHK